MPGCPQDNATPMGALNPVAVVLHRTYGQWPGDYNVIKNNSLCHFLIGQQDGQWVQFVDTNAVTYHCNGANFRAVGIELTGTNDDPLTDWQVTKLGDVLRYLNSAHGIPLGYVDAAVTPPASIWVNSGGFSGIISHDSVQTDDGSAQHTDAVSLTDYQRAVATTVIPPSKKDDDPMLYVFNPHDQAEIWCFAGNLRRHVTPDEWAFCTYVGTKAVKVSAAWFDSYPEAA
jgi:hypothetical protein